MLSCIFRIHTHQDKKKKTNKQYLTQENGEIWLKLGDLMREMESLLKAAQNNVIRANHINKTADVGYVVIYTRWSIT